MELDKIRILGIDYSVEYSDLRKQNGCTDVGNIDLSGCKIHIDSNVNSSEHMRSVVLHEILEALKARLELDLEHKVVTQLEAGLIQVIRDNPRLLLYLTEETPS